MSKKTVSSFTMQFRTYDNDKDDTSGISAEVWRSDERVASLPTIFNAHFNDNSDSPTYELTLLKPIAVDDIPRLRVDFTMGGTSDTWAYAVCLAFTPTEGERIVYYYRPPEMHEGDVYHWEIGSLTPGGNWP
jgi:hypothetical protein